MVVVSPFFFIIHIIKSVLYAYAPSETLSARHVDTQACGLIDWRGSISGNIPCYLQGLGEQKRTKYKINGTATTAIEKSNPNRPAKSRLPYSYQEHEQGEQKYTVYCTRSTAPVRYPPVPHCRDPPPCSSGCAVYFVFNTFLLFQILYET